MKTQCPIIVESKKPLTKQQLLDRLGVLEVKADHYSRTDYVRYDEVCAEIKDLDAKLLDIYNSENETWLQSKRQA